MNNTKMQKGFTLIELMIVVTIIGILASIAVPVYRDYTIRSRVTECASVFGTLKTEMSMFNSNNGNMPVDLTELAIEGRVSDVPGDYRGDYVSTMVVTNGSVRCTLRNLTTLGSATGDYVSFDISIAGIVISWSIGGSVEDRYLPVLN